MKIAVCQINPVIADFSHNAMLIRKALDAAKSSKCQLAVFPEMCLTGYPPRDLLERPGFIRENLRQLDKLASETSGISIICGYVDNNKKKSGMPLINSAAFISNGRVIAKGGKKLLPTYDVFDETRYFEPAPQSLVFELEDIKIGVTICEDIWRDSNFPGIPKYEQDPIPDIMSQNIDILFNIAASPYSINKGALRLQMLQRLTSKLGLPVLYCNQVGGNDELLFDGSSMVVDQTGRLILLAEQFDSDMLVWNTEKKYDQITNPWPSEEESILKGLIMGTRDYSLKCGFTKALVGLSGGIDSSLVAYIAAKALGPENITGISMPSQFTSEMSREDSRKISENLGINFIEIPISELYDLYIKTLSKFFDNLEPDNTEENIQARIRGNILMAFSNKFNCLLLSTGNKSEFAVGYCTLYGDMDGGLAVISDIPKTTCYRLAHFINHNEEVIPDRVISRPPSAELKPDQTDQDTLPPYPVLDDILEKTIERKLGPEELIAAGHDKSVVDDVLRRVILNEYKRYQSPPGLRITSKAFGSGWRYPLAKGKLLY